MTDDESQRLSEPGSLTTAALILGGVLAVSAATRPKGRRPFPQMVVSGPQCKGDVPDPRGKPKVFVDCRNDGSGCCAGLKVTTKQDISVANLANPTKGNHIDLYFENVGNVDLKTITYRFRLYNPNDGTDIVNKTVTLTNFKQGETQHKKKKVRPDMKPKELQAALSKLTYDARITSWTRA